MRVPPASVYFPAEDRETILRHIDDCLSTGQLTLGKYGKELEDRFAAYLGVKHAVAVSSGTSAIEIPLRILGVEGREVLVPANTFFATAAAVLHAGGCPRFVDCDPETMAIDPADLRRAIGPETAGVILVHVAGLVTSAIAEIRQICDEAGIWLFEDAAHAHGSAHAGRMAGTFGIAASFSFYPTKVIAGGEVGLSGEVYDTPLHQQPVFAEWAERSLPGAERLCDRHICLSVSAVMTDEQAEWVVDSLRSALSRLAD